MGSSRPDPMPRRQPFGKRGFIVGPVAWGPWFTSPFPTSYFRLFFKHGGRRGPRLCCQQTRAARHTQRERAGKACSGAQRQHLGQEAIRHCWARPRQQVTGDLHVAPEPGACAEERQEGPDRAGGAKSQQRVGTSSCFMELVPAALRLGEEGNPFYLL